MRFKIGLAYNWREICIKISVTSIGSTLVKCPPKSSGLLPSEICKDPPIVPYKKGQILRDILVQTKLSKRLLHVGRSCVGLFSEFCGTKYNFPKPKYTFLFDFPAYN